MKLSIIIPVYRTEDTLDRCVESVLHQDHPDMEVILVDDGSPDRCPVRCDDWAAKDRRIRVVHKVNGGLSDARNAGIGIATGDYVTFVDSDDYLAEDTYGPLMQRLGQQPDIDILEYPVYVHYGSPRQYLTDFKPETTYHDMETYWLDGRAYQHTYACNKIFRKSLFEEVRFPVGRVFEDTQTLPRLLEKTGTVVTCSLGLYYYCSNSNGITQTADGQALQMLLQPHVEMIGRIRRKDKAFETYYLHVLNIQMDVFELTGSTPILPLLPVKSSHFTGTQKIKAIALNLLGINRICQLNKILHKVWRSR
ncbi:MAG: glycosyltransferase family 2 protein [Prevotella sp.]|nr:glycosyltransferase family 2 protein [Prevotella sp.]